MDPQNFNLLAILKFRRGKDDFTFDKSTEHTFISKFVSYLAKSADGDWRRAASLLDSAVLKVMLFFMYCRKDIKRRGDRERVGQHVDATT